MIVKWFEDQGLVPEGMRLVRLSRVDMVEEWLARMPGDIPPLALGVGAIPCA